MGIRRLNRLSKLIWRVRVKESKQREVLEGFLEFHGIDVPVSARLSHLGRRFRAFFPEIADPIHPYPGKWTRVPVCELARRVEQLDPAGFRPKPDCSHFQKPVCKQQTKTQQFLRSPDWRRLRYQIFQRDGRVCACCGARSEDGARLEIDHIKPISKHWHLRLDPENLQVLCRPCNKGKSNAYDDDFRRRRRS